ncbi:MAG: tetratricopeptide repeat protein, partial [Candidatus Accumulibacter sp.]|nr:tetratricopeptide repeat protein [Accumulibacter sp.]
ELYRFTGAYAKAEPLYQRALAINEKALGPDHPDTARSLSNFADLYTATGAYAKAEPLYQRALAIHEKALGPDHPYTAVSLNALADLYTVTGAYAKAEPLLERALAINEKALGPDHPGTATSLNDFAALYYGTGAYAKAESLHQRALAIYEKALGPDHPDTATSLNNLADLYTVTGAYAKAEPLLQRTLAIREQALGLDHPDTARSLNNLGALYSTTGVYAKAEPLLQRALAIHEKALGPDHPDTAGSLNTLAVFYETIGVPGKAEPLYQRALEITEKALGPDHPSTAASLNNLAALYYAAGVPGKAEPLYQRALAIREEVLGPDHPDTATSLNNLADLYHDTGRNTKAEPLIERAQRIEEGNTARFLLSGSETRKRAYIEQRVGYTNANISFSLAVADPRAKALGLTSVLQQKGRVLDAMSDSIARLRQSVAREDRERFEQLAEVAQQFSTLTFRGLGNLPVDAYRQRLQALAQQQEQLEAEFSKRSAAFRQAVTPVTLEGVRQALPADAVLVEWFRYKPFNSKAKGSARWGVPRYVAYVLKRSGDAVAIDLGAAQPIEALISELRDVLSDLTYTIYKEAAKELSKTLIAPLLPHLAQNERLLLSPDGALNLVPFGALVDEHGEYLVQRFEITYLTSGRDLLRMAVASLARGSAVMIADPAYGQSAGQVVAVDRSIQPSRSNDLDRSGLVFKPLAGTVAEAKALQVLLKIDGQHVLTGANATEANLKQLHGPRLLHVATHGFFLTNREVATLVLKPAGPGHEAFPLPLGENPLLRSGLAMAGANVRHSGENDDGILTAAEAAQLDLDGTQLVVLSACDTGVGQVKTGEGVYGLRRALVLAGAQTQVASLWKVDDVASKELMVDYYGRLLAGEGRSGALRAAQKAMMTTPGRQHPYYWAAFVPIGNWTPLSAEQ